MDLTGIKNIIFDFGGVLVNLNQQACMDALSRMGVKNVADYLTPFGHQGPFGQLESGAIDLPTFRAEIRKIFHLSEAQAGDETIDNAWAAFLEDIPYKKIKLLYALSRKYRVFLLSNTNPIHIRSLKQFDQAGYPLKECFEKLYYSFEIGSSKPGREIFDYVINDAAILPEETLLVDDGPANCATAESLGMKTFCPETSADFCEELFPEETAFIQSSSFPERPFQACVATMGFFDGVHAGHRYLIETLKKLARQKCMPSMVLSFWPHPRRVLQMDYCPQLLTDSAEKQQLLKQCGADKTVLMTFDNKVANLSAYDFMRDVLKEKYHVTCLLIGYDHHFGHGRNENFKDYQRYGRELGIEVIKAEAYAMSDKPFISSSYIRRCLLDGKIEEANKALGYEYSFSGKVTKGFGNGHKIGFPTANILLSDDDKLIPLNGSYAVDVLVKSQKHLGMLNIGTRPTMHDGGARSIEVYIFDFADNIYGEEIRIFFKKFLREEYRFTDVEALAGQLSADRTEILRIFGAK